MCFDLQGESGPPGPVGPPVRTIFLLTTFWVFCWYNISQRHRIWRLNLYECLFSGSVRSSRPEGRDWATRKTGKWVSYDHQESPNINERVNIHVSCVYRRVDQDWTASEERRETQPVDLDMLTLWVALISAPFASKLLSSGLQHTIINIRCFPGSSRSTGPPWTTWTFCSHRQSESIGFLFKSDLTLKCGNE